MEIIGHQKDIGEEVKQTNLLYRGKKSIGEVPTGFDRVDSIIGGFHQSNLIYIAARPAMGKTSLMLSIILKTIQNGDSSGVVLFSLEHSKAQIGKKLAYSNAEVNELKANMNELSEKEHDMIIDSFNVIGNSGLYVSDECGLTIQGLSEECKKIKKEQDIKIIFVDYLQLMGTDRKYKKRIECEREIIIGLKSLAKELSIPVVVFAQLNRSVEKRKDHRPLIDDICDYSGVEDIADLIMFIYRKKYYDRKADDTAEIIIAKNNNGLTGVAELKWQSEHVRFEDK